MSSKIGTCSNVPGPGDSDPVTATAFLPQIQIWKPGDRIRTPASAPISRAMMIVYPAIGFARLCSRTAHSAGPPHNPPLLHSCCTLVARRLHKGCSSQRRCAGADSERIRLFDIVKGFDRRAWQSRGLCAGRTLSWGKPCRTIPLSWPAFASHDKLCVTNTGFWSGAVYGGKIPCYSLFPEEGPDVSFARTPAAPRFRVIWPRRVEKIP
jgi:hypothetical protein